MNIPLITALKNISPKDPHWLQESEHEWFLPGCLDIKNNSYSGYWYGNQNSTEELHCHSGVAHGSVLQGAFKLKMNKKEYDIKATQNYFIPPQMMHEGELIIEDGFYLMFVTVCGFTQYQNERVDVKSYYEKILAHYRKHNLKLEDTQINLP